MAKRVSLKGKGADLFFGDYTPAPPEAESAAEPVAPAADAPGADPTVSNNQLAHPDPSPLSATNAESPSLLPDNDQQARKQASQPARKHGRVQGATASVASADQPDADPSTSTVQRVCDRVNEPATITNSFRYTEEELSTLTDVLYDIGKRRGAKLTKQDVARLGLNFVLQDYEARGEASLLGQLALQRKRQSRRRG